MLAAKALPDDATSDNIQKNRLTQPRLQSGLGPCSPKAVDTLSTPSHVALYELPAIKNKRKLSFPSFSFPNDCFDCDCYSKISDPIVLRNLELKISSEKVVWNEWKIGDESTKTFSMQNIGNSSLKIGFEAPSTQFVSTLYPQVITLAAGTTFKLPITFRPLNADMYEDRIHFSTSLGPFSLLLQAVLPKFCIRLPESIHFGLSAVNVLGELRFFIKNMSELETKFSWEVSAPFQIIPMSGTIQPRSTIKLHAIFFPSTASVFKATAVCIYGDNLKLSMLLDGIGKFPYVIASSSSELAQHSDPEQFVLTFKKIFLHEKVQSAMYLHNVSSVPASYKITPLPNINYAVNPFSCSTFSGFIPPMKTEKIMMKYAPHNASKTNVGYFEVTTAGKVSKSIFKCIGSSDGPNVVTSVSLIDFGLLNEDQDSTLRSFELINHYSCDAIYQFDLDQKYGVFCVDAPSGLISGKQSKRIIVKFEPLDPGNYYRRATLLVHEQEPQFIDMIGTKYSSNDQPPVLLPEHLNGYKLLTSRGLSMYSPHILQKKIIERKLDIDACGYPIMPDKPDTNAQNLGIEGGMAEYFNDGHSTEITVAKTHCIHYNSMCCPNPVGQTNPPLVSLDKMYIWMGKVFPSDDQSVAWSTPVTLFNYTFGKVVVTWFQDLTGIFNVYPIIDEVQPMKSAEFLLTFSPNAVDQVYHQILECYVSYKCLRDYRIVKKNLVFPPWRLHVEVSGYTSSESNRILYPQFTISSESLIFPPSEPNSSSYKTIVIKNTGPTPLLYQFLKSLQGLTIKPPLNVATSGYQIVVLRLTPKRVGTIKDKMLLKLNGNISCNKIIQLKGSGEQAELLISNEGRLYFKPTCVYSTSVSENEIQNICCLSVHFKWIIPPHINKILTVSPSEGLLLPYEKQVFKWSFTPSQRNEYFFIVNCHAWCHRPHSQTELEVEKQARQCKLRVIATSVKAAIRADKQIIDLGTVLARSTVKDDLLLYNDSMCDLLFALSLKQVIDNEYGEDPDPNEPMGLDLSTWKSVVSARSKLKVTLSAHIRRRVTYSWYLFYEQLTSSGEHFPSSEQTLICQVVAEGVYPSLTVIEVRPDSSRGDVSRPQLWSWFNVDSFNLHLDCDPDKRETEDSLVTKRRSLVKPDMLIKSVVQFNFGAAPLSAEAFKANVVFFNPSSVLCKWCFLFPSDLEMDLEPWAAGGYQDENQLHYSFVQGNNLFQVSPVEGQLNPNQKGSVQFSYSHEFIGTHQIPVLFKIDNGKEVLINFIGVTVEPGRPYLHFPSTKHYFDPISVGESHPPKQMFELYNGGSVPVTYHVDQSPLDIMKEDNYQHPILTCVTYAGVIPPCSSFCLELVFSPLESKTYTVDVPIHITNGETALVTLEGSGYDSRVMGRSMPLLGQDFFKLLRLEDGYWSPDQIVSQSKKCIRFGNIPLYARVHDVFFLTNRSTDTPIVFNWVATAEDAKNMLRLQPSNGRLEPRQSTMCAVTFCGGGPPSFYDFHLICEIMNLKKLAAFRGELEAWKAERDRQAAEFCFVSKAVPVDEDESREEKPCRRSAKTERVVKKKPSILLSRRKSSVKHENRTFSTLPPLRKHSIEDDHTLSKYRRDVSGNREWVRPVRPEPQFTHLTVTARTHDVANFRTVFTADNDRHFLDRTMQMQEGEMILHLSPSREFDVFGACSKFEKSMIEEMLSHVIRSLLDDHTFHEDIRKLEDIPVPYFMQVPTDRVADPPLEEDTIAITVTADDDNNEAMVSAPIQQGMLNYEETRQHDRPVETNNVGSEPAQYSCGLQSNNDGLPERSSIAVLENENVKSDPSFVLVVEELLSLVVENIMEEAVHGEVNLTMRPRAIALPSAAKHNNGESAMIFLNELQSSLSPASNGANTLLPSYQV